jgi:hypothetical protein
VLWVSGGSELVILKRGEFAWVGKWLWLAVLASIRPALLQNVLLRDTGVPRTGSLKAMLTDRELKREQAWSRIHLVPLILAEQDRDAYRRNQAAIAREKEIMKDVEGWEVSCLNSSHQG